MSDGAWAIRNFGARGIKLRDTSIVFAHDKVVVSTPDPTEHYTLHLGQDSGVLDVHRTWDELGTRRHETLFAIRHADLPNVIGECASFVSEIQGLLRPFPYERLATGRCRVASLFPTTPSAVAEVTTKTRQRLTFSEERLRAYSKFADTVEDLILEFPDCAFALLDATKWRLPVIGIGIKSTSGHLVKLAWFGVSDAARLFAALPQKAMESALKYAIKPESYGDYSFLTPRSAENLNHRTPSTDTLELTDKS
jgi:hypothetical protein